MSKTLFSALADGTITADRHHDYAFDDVAQAHRDMEARKTAGAVLLVVVVYSIGSGLAAAHCQDQAGDLCARYKT